MKKNLKQFIEEWYLEDIKECYELDFEDEVSEENQHLLDYVITADTLDDFVERAAEIRVELDKVGDGIELDSLSPLFGYAQKTIREYGRFENEDLYGHIIVV